MKKTITIIISLLVVAGIITTIIFINKTPENIERECLDVYAPVCSINNTTYDNSCLAEQEGIIEYEKGECGTEINITTNKLSENQLKNTNYYSPTYELSFKLEDGKYENKEDHMTAGLTNTVFGDLDGDNIEDAAVVTYISGGGSGVFMELHVVLNDYGIPVCFASTELGDRVQIEDISIENKIVKLNIVTHGSNDPMCCPTEKKYIEYSFKNFQLTKKED